MGHWTHRNGWKLLLAATAAGCGTGGAVALEPPRAVRPGIEVLLADSAHLVTGRRVGFVTNLAAVDSRGVSGITRLREAGVTIAALFGPEHGLDAQAKPGEKVASGVDSATRTPIYSLYGTTARPTPEMLQGIEVLVIDLPDVGTRYYTYVATAINVMRSAAEARIPVVILDRPNPIAGVMEGNILDPAHASMVGPMETPMRHGMTIGELARLAKRDFGLAVELTVVPAAGWQRGEYLEATGLPFVPPSPNLKDVDALIHYPGTCLFEGTALSVGRGTDHPFHQIGAPWLDVAGVIDRMNALALPGVRFEPVTFTPRNPGDAKHPDVEVKGIRLVITDRASYRPVATAVHLLAAVRSVHPDQIRLGGIFDRLAGGPVLREALLRGDDMHAMVAGWDADVAAFAKRVEGLLIY